jgi:hypothetical protein
MSEIICKKMRQKIRSDTGKRKLFENDVKESRYILVKLINSIVNYKKVKNQKTKK